MVGNELDTKIDKTLYSEINLNINAPGYLDGFIKGTLANKHESQKRKRKMKSIIPALGITFMNSILIAILTLSYLQSTNSILEKVIILYIGFSLISLLGVFVLIVDELYKDSNQKAKNKIFQKVEVDGNGC